MFNSGIIAHSYLDGWSVRNTPLDTVDLTNKRRTATLAAGVTQAKSFRAARGVSTGQLDCWISFDAVADKIAIGIVGAAVTALSTESGNSTGWNLGVNSGINMIPSVGWDNGNRIAPANPNMSMNQVWSVGTAATGGPDKVAQGTVIKMNINADTGVVTLTQADGSALPAIHGGSPFRTFEVADQRPFYPAATLRGEGAQVTLYYSDPT